MRTSCWSEPRPPSWTFWTAFGRTVASPSRRARPDPSRRRRLLHRGALILRDVGNLTPEGQRRLMEWLDDNVRDRVQVIATNAAPLWPQVRDGTFTEALYYRLNVIYIDLTDGASLSTG